jgi:hypothetical protein
LARREQDEPELVRAAMALEDELSALEGFAKTLAKTRLDSEKNLARAERELALALAVPERLATGLGKLATELAKMQARQAAALDPITARAAEIEARKLRLDEHLRAFATLGQVTAEITAMLQGETGESRTLDAVRTRLTSAADDAGALFRVARDDDFPDVAREADSLCKRLTHLRGLLESTKN